MSKNKSNKSSTSSIVAFTKAVNSISKSQKTFEKSVSHLKTLISETFSDLETKLNAKQKELEALEEVFVHKKRTSLIEMDLNLKEHAYEEAVRILSEHGEVAVNENSYEELKNSHEELKKSHDEDVERAVKKEQERNNKHVAVLKQTMELKNSAEVAKVEAQLESQTREIETLNKTIDRLSHDLEQQRQLTKDVANASAKSLPMYLPQQSSVSNR